MQMNSQQIAWMKGFLNNASGGDVEPAPVTLRSPVMDPDAEPATREAITRRLPQSETPPGTLRTPEVQAPPEGAPPPPMPAAEPIEHAPVTLRSPGTPESATPASAGEAAEVSSGLRVQVGPRQGMNPFADTLRPDQLVPPTQPSLQVQPVELEPPSVQVGNPYVVPMAETQRSGAASISSAEEAGMPATLRSAGNTAGEVAGAAESEAMTVGRQAAAVTSEAETLVVAEEGAVGALGGESGALAAGAKVTGAAGAIGAVVGGGIAIYNDADKVKSGSMSAVDATADVVVEGVTGAAAAIAGAETGAAAGAAIGSIVPGAGTAVGAAVGVVVGGIAGYAANALAHDSGIVDDAKHALSGALTGAEEPLKQAWDVAAEGVDAVKQAGSAVAETAGSVAGSLWDGAMKMAGDVAGTAVQVGSDLVAGVATGDVAGGAMRRRATPRAVRRKSRPMRSERQSRNGRGRRAATRRRRPGRGRGRERRQRCRPGRVSNGPGARAGE